MSEVNQALLTSLGELTDEPVEQTGPSGDFVYVDISSIDRETKKISDPKSLTLSLAPSRAKQVLKTGDVLVSMTRPNLNAVALVPEQLDGAIGSTGLHVLRSRWLSPGFLLALVQTQSFIDAMSSVVQGALYPAVRPRDIAAYAFSFETPVQQTRIVAKLEELLSDLDAGVAELKAAQKKLAQYRQSLLKAAVEGALTAEWRAQRKAAPSPQPPPRQGGGAKAVTTGASWATSAPLPPGGGGVGGEGATPVRSIAAAISPVALSHARELRRNQTPQEQALWQALRAKRFAGYKFRRQQPLGRYIVDFVCFSRRLAVELDGGQHADAVDKDAQRDAWLREQGFRVLRVWNNEWSMQPDAVLEAVWQALQSESPPLPNPSPARGEGLKPETVAGIAPLMPAEDKAEGLTPRPSSAGGTEVASLPTGEGAAGGEGETGAQLLVRILTERRARWEAKQLAKFKELGKTPPKDWQRKYPEPVQPDTTDLPELPEGWVWASVDQLSESVRNGVSKTPNTEQRGFPIFKINAVRPMAVNFAAIKHIELDEAVAADFWVEEGDILATRYNGSVDLLGVFGMVRNVPERTLHPDKLIRMKPVTGAKLGAWMEVCGNVGASRAHLVSRVKTTAGQTGISGEDLKKTPIPLAPAAEQEMALAILEARLEAIKELEQPTEHALKQATAQRQNILRAAFSGQLVPQDPNDEPASVLLERIRAERTGLDAVKKRRWCIIRHEKLT